MTNNTPSHSFHQSVDELTKINAEVKAALAEDIGSGDLTAQLVPPNTRVTAAILVREKAVICGIDWVNACFKQIDPETEIMWHVKDGQHANADQVLCHISGEARALLTTERCALNFLQTLSATATQTHQFVEAISGTQAKILDTRKTIPHFRFAQKYAVRVGGGQNQRFALYDGILIKENHIAAAGSIPNVLNQAAALNSQKSIQIEVENITQLKEALAAGATSILLDNFDVPRLKEAVNLNKSFQIPAVLEASGGIDLKNVREIAETGVDRISIGSITKNIRAIDLSMRILH